MHNNWFCRIAYVSRRFHSYNKHKGARGFKMSQSNIGAMSPPRCYDCWLTSNASKSIAVINGSLGVFHKAWWLVPLECDGVGVSWCCPYIVWNVMWTCTGMNLCSVNECLGSSLKVPWLDLLECDGVQMNWCCAYTAWYGMIVCIYLFIYLLKLYLYRVNLQK